MIWEAFYKGLVYGLFLVLSLGPIFFFLLETSIERGFISALFVALGTLASDMLYIIIMYFSFSSIFDNVHVRFWMGVIGGIVLILFGIYNFFKPGIRKRNAVNVNSTATPNWLLLVKAFTINTINPFAPLFWIASSAYVSAHTEYTRASYLMFFAGTLTTVFSTDVLKGFLAHTIKDYISHHNMRWMNYLAGVVMIGFGLEILWQVYHGGVQLIGKHG